MTGYQWRDIGERLAWTFIAAFVGQLVGVAALNLDVTAIQSAAVAGLGAVATGILGIARWRLSVLPDPASAVAAHVGALDPPCIDCDDNAPHGVNPELR